MNRLRTLLREFVRRTEGQDVVEYALLSAAIGVAAIAAMDTLLGAMGVSYQDWIGEAQALWDPPAPGGS